MIFPLLSGMILWEGYRIPEEPNPDDDLKHDNSCDTNNNGVADVPCPGLQTRDFNDGLNRGTSPDMCPVKSLVECYYVHASLNMGENPVYYSADEFQDLMMAIFYEVDGRNPADLISSSMSFDTPFYDKGRLRFGALPGTGCIEGLGCYARHELNYVAQGIVAAGAGESKLGGLDRVYAWKAVMGPLRTPSSGTITMWNIGYDFYHAQKGTAPPRDMREYYWIDIK